MNVSSNGSGATPGELGCRLDLHEERRNCGLPLGSPRLCCSGGLLPPSHRREEPATCAVSGRIVGDFRGRLGSSGPCDRCVHRRSPSGPNPRGDPVDRREVERSKPIVISVASASDSLTRPINWREVREHGPNPKRAFMWAFLCDEPAPIIAYRFSPSRSGETAGEVLGSSQGTLVVDMYT